MIFVVFIVLLRVGIILRILSHDKSPIKSVYSLQSRMAVVELCSGLTRPSGVSKRVERIDWALSNARNAIIKWRRALMQSVPMNRCVRSSHCIGNVYHDIIPFTDMNRRARHFPVDGHDHSLKPISSHALLFKAIFHFRVLLSSAIPTSP